MTFEPDDVFWIKDAETFEVLGDPLRIEILELCGHTARSVGELAEAMDVPRTRLYHHVNLMEEKGLITVADTRQKGAMTEKLYRASAHSYQPAESFLHETTPLGQAEAIISSLLGATRVDFLRAAERRQLGLQDIADARRVSLGRRMMKLTPARLAMFIADLEDLFEQYEHEPDDPEAIPVATLHIVHPSSREMA